MPRHSGPMLFAAPEPPVWVPRSRPLVIGRSADCDLVVPSGTASRQHAEVYWEEGSVYIRDLGSRNGTWVNGHRIAAPQALSPGDTVLVGSTRVAFCCPAAGDRTASRSQADQTSELERSSLLGGEDALRGELSRVPVDAILQMLATGRETGVLGLVTPQGTAQMWLEDGDPVHAETARSDGMAAALEICRFQEGRFLFQGDVLAPRQTLSLSVEALLLEASRLADERRREPLAADEDEADDWAGEDSATLPAIPRVSGSGS